MAKLLLLDGNSLAYRAFFALPTDLATASGQVTNAVLGFANMLTYAVNEQKPDGIAVAFDLPQPTFRHELVQDYKAGRAEAPDILRQQMGLVRQVVEVLNIPLLEAPGFEADDIIATLATQARDRGDDVVIVTGDRDSFQLVEDPHIRVMYNKRGVSDYALYDEAGIVEKTGVTPDKYPIYAAFRGDNSDNLPGVPGVGEKTAAKLINDYGDIDGVYANLDKCTPKLRENLAAAEAQVRSNALATPLVRDVPIECSVEDLRIGGWDVDAARTLFNFLEFRAAADRLLEALGAQAEGEASAEAGAALDVAVQRFPSGAAAAAFVDGLATACLMPSWSGAPGRSALAGLAVAADAETVGWLDEDLLADTDVVVALRGLCGREQPSVSTHDAKLLIRGLAPLDVDVKSLDLDTAIAAYLIDPAGDQYVLDAIALRYAGIEVRSPDAPPAGQLDLDGTASDPADDAARRAAAVATLLPPMSSALDARGLRELYETIERPLVRVLARMEQVGIRVDAEYLKGLVKTLTDEVRQLEQEIQDLAGEPFKVNSTPQLRTILFDKLGLQPQKKTKTGFSTDAASLEKLLGQHPIIEKLLRYREVEKLRNTYGESLLAEVAPDGRIHATFNQTVARTGRLSSDQPNLHNIPIRTEEGRQFRRAFLPEQDWKLLVADYNQIELRVIAHLAQDPGLIEAFTSGADVHTATASKVFAVAPEDVSIGQRSKAKMVSYGLAYGMESYGLAARLNIPVPEAEELRNAYFEAFPAVRNYMRDVVREARSKGYTETLFGRRRQIPELADSNFRIRQAGERQAMNAGIQGLAADIFKVALVRLDEALEREGLASRIVLQVHDEIILESPPEEHDRAAELTLDAMRNACPQLSIPLEVNIAWGDSWESAKA